MATYRKRKNQDGSIGHQFIVRRKGFEVMTKTFTRKTDGECWSQDLESSMRNGRFVLSAEAKETSLATLIDMYVGATFQERKSQQTPLQTLTWWKDKVGTVALSNVSKSLIRRHWIALSQEISPRTGKVRSNRTLNAYIETLSACFSYAVQEELLHQNPLLNFKRKPLNNSREVLLTEDQLKALLNEAKASSNKYLEVALLMTLSCGGRRSEIMGLHWNEVNLLTGEVRFDKTKNGKPRTVILGRAALDALNRHSKVRVLGSALIFPPLKPRRLGASAKFSTVWEDLRAPFKRACKKANVAQLRWHDLRHCAASYLLMSGASVPEMMKILGHQSASMSWRYGHIDQQRTIELVNLVNDKFLSNSAA